MQLELVMYTIRKLLESKLGAEVHATYPPKNSDCFNPSCGEDYHNFIIYTQKISGISKSGMGPITLYLYYRNKRTVGEPEFSSCECGMFIGKRFSPLFKEHIAQLSEAEFAQIIVDKIINYCD